MYKFRKWLQLLLMAGFVPALLVALAIRSHLTKPQHSPGQLPNPLDSTYAMFPLTKCTGCFSYPVVQDTVTAADLLLVDSLFRVAALKEPDSGQILSTVRQCVAVRLASGERQIYMSCFHAEHDAWEPDWRKKLIAIEDGGRYVFECTVSLTKRTITPFQFHGDA